MQIGGIKAIVMELFKNKVSKKYFISIDEVNAGKLLMITPEGEVKPLEAHLFEGPYTKSEGAPGVHRYVNKQQMKKYHQYTETLMPR